MNIPAFRMLVIGALVPAAGIRLGGIVRIRSHRTHLDGIVFHNQRGRHVVPRAHQANHLGLRRSELQIKPAFARSIEPALVDTRREQRRRLRALGVREIHHLGPFVLTTVNIEQGRRGTPICGLDCRRCKIVVVPVRVRILLSRDGIVQDVIADGNIHRTVAETGVGSPGVVDVQHVGRIETCPETPYGVSNLRRRNRSVYKNRVVAVQMRAQVQHSFCRCSHVGSQVPHKKSRLQRIPLHHRWRQRRIEPAALGGIVHGKAHHHRIFGKDQIGQGLVAPGTLEPDHLGTRSHKRNRVRHIRGIRVEPEFFFSAEKRDNLYIACFGPRFLVIVVEILVGSIRVNRDAESLPLLETGNVLAPGIAEPAVALVGHDGLRRRTVFRIVVGSSAQYVQCIPGFRGVVTPGRLNMYCKAGERTNCRHQQKQA